jgi:hypothetical protein
MPNSAELQEALHGQESKAHKTMRPNSTMRLKRPPANISIDRTRIGGL